MDIYNFNYKFYREYYNLNSNLTKEKIFEDFIQKNNKESLFYNDEHSYYYQNYDWDYYIFVYRDLKKYLKSHKEGYEHYMKKGKLENRIIYNKNNDYINYILNYRLFNWKEYLVLNSDLKKVFTTQESCVEHFIIHGFKENRKFSINYELLLKRIENKYPIKMTNIYLNNILKLLNNETPYDTINEDLSRFESLYINIVKLLNKKFNKDLIIPDHFIREFNQNVYNYTIYKINYNLNKNNNININNENKNKNNKLTIIDEENKIIYKNNLIEDLKNTFKNINLSNETEITFVISNKNNRITLNSIKYNKKYENTIKILPEFKNIFIDKSLLTDEKYLLYIKYNWNKIIMKYKLDENLIKVIDNYNKNKLIIKDINKYLRHHYYLKFNLKFHNENNIINQNYPCTYYHYVLYYLFDWDKIIEHLNEKNKNNLIKDSKDIFFNTYINQYKKYNIKLFLNDKKIINDTIINSSIINILFFDIQLLQNIIKWNFLNNDILFLKELFSIVDEIKNKLDYSIEIIYKPKFFDILVTNNEDEDLLINKNIKFSFIISSYNNENNILDNIYSILYQDYKNWDILYTNDASTDKTEDYLLNIIKEFNLENRITYIKNEINKKQSYNKFHMYKKSNKNNILVILDGDDWLSQNNVLSEINKTYNTKKCFMLYTAHKIFINNKIDSITGNHSYDEETKKYGNYRLNDKWLFGHIRTGYSWLYKMIPESYLKYKNEWLDRCTDMAENYCIAEISKHRIENITKACTIYNKNNSLLYSNSYYHDTNSKKRKEIEYYVKKKEKLKVVIPDIYIIQDKINIKNKHYFYVQEKLYKNKKNKIYNIFELFKVLLNNNTSEHYLIIYSDHFNILKNKEEKLFTTQVFLKECDFLILDNHLKIENKELFNHINIKDNLQNFNFDEIKSFIISRRFIEFILYTGINSFIDNDINLNNFIDSCVDNTLINDFNLYVLTEPIVYY